MTTPPQFPQKPQLPPQIRALLPTDTTGASPRLPPEYRLQLVAGITAAAQRNLQSKGILTRREMRPDGGELRIKHNHDEQRKVFAVILADTLQRELADIGITVTSTGAGDTRHIHFDIGATW